ncbi:MAG: hypothetical protein HKN13_11400, partial [Rhodothermales bacterium]|nr:hypothetical protein [Rhodothermales bacterium]
MLGLPRDFGESLKSLLGWHAGTAIFLVFAPSLLVDQPLWSLPKTHAGFLLCWSAVYFFSATYASLYKLSSSGGIANRIAIPLAAHGLLLAAIVVGHFHSLRLAKLVESDLFQATLVVTFLAGGGLFLASFWLHRMRSARILLFAIVVVAFAFSALDPFHEPSVEAKPEDRLLNTSLYPVRVRAHPIGAVASTARGGGIDKLGGGYLLVNGDGAIFHFAFSKSGDEIVLRQLSYSVPLNAEAFQADSHESVQTSRFRVADVLVREAVDLVEVFASHHFWNTARQCFVMRVSRLQTSGQDFLVGSDQVNWKTVFESKPCLPISGEKRGNPFAGHLSGGRLAMLDDSQLLLTVGDHAFNGWKTKRQLAQDPTADYGKTVLIDLEDESSRIFSMGHRNPQGLYINEQGEIWLTEHGSRGGDELNRIHEQRNYGWPRATFGTAYDAFRWPLSDPQGAHDGFEPPVFAWVPSAGISSLVQVEGGVFGLWKNDLLVASLNGRSVFRVRVLDNRAVVVEPIKVGRRIRDILVGHDGRIILYADDASIVALWPSEASESGELIFAAQCWGCHNAVKDAPPGIGPNLWNIVGRPIANEPGYAYSAGLQRVDGEWSVERLSRFLADPQSVSPGTSMEFKGITE